MLTPDIAAVFHPEYLPEDFKSFDPNRWNSFYYGAEKIPHIMRDYLREKIKQTPLNFDEKSILIKKIKWLDPKYRDNLIRELAQEVGSQSHLFIIIEIALESDSDDSLLASELKRLNLPHEIWKDGIKIPGYCLCGRVIAEKAIETTPHLMDLFVLAKSNPNFTRVFIEKLPDLKIQVSLQELDEIEKEFPLKNKAWKSFLKFKTNQRAKGNYQLPGFEEVVKQAK
ncbi:MAG: hypothetical protein WC470_02725 [Candidatus Paceibacterota bacterium]